MTQQEIEVLVELIKKEKAKKVKPKTDRQLIEDILARVKKLEEKDNTISTPYVPWSQPMYLCEHSHTGFNPGSF